MAAVAVESRDRVEPGSFDIPLGSYPQTSPAPENPDQIATEIVNQLNNALSKKDGNALTQMFLENSYWRDHLCFSWEFRTLKGRPSIADYVTKSPSTLSFEVDRSSALKAPHAGPIDAFGEVHGVEFFTKLTTNFGSGDGIVRLALQGSEWKIFTVFTSLVQITGHEDKISAHRPVGVQHGEQQGRKNWQDRRNATANFEEKDPAVLVVGMHIIILTYLRNGPC